jgi:NADH dehydrogenase
VLSRVVCRAPVVPVLGDGRSKIQPVSVENVAQAFVRALRDDRTVQRTYDLVGPLAFSWNELYDQLLAHHGLQKPRLHLPLWLARIQAVFLEKLFKYPPFNREQIVMSREDNVGDPAPAEKDLGLEQESFAAGLARYLS